MNMDSCKCCKIDAVKSKQIALLSSSLKILSEENRLRILCILQNDQHCVCQIFQQLKLSQSLVSHHLKDLKDLGIIDSTKKGLYVHYFLTQKGKKITNLLFQL